MTRFIKLLMEIKIAISQTSNLFPESLHGCSVRADLKADLVNCTKESV